MKIFDFHLHPGYDFHNDELGYEITPELFVQGLAACGVDFCAGSVIHKADTSRPLDEYAEILPDNEPDMVEQILLQKMEAEDLTDTKNMKMNINISSQLAYEEAMKELLGDLQSFCNSRGALFVSVPTDQPIEKVLFKELLKVGIIE